LNEREKRYDIGDFEIWKNTAQALRGSSRRRYMAQTVSLLGWGGQRFAEKVLGWNRTTIRKGKSEIESNKNIIDRFHYRGRKRAEAHLPKIIDDIKSIVEPISQTDPTFRSRRLYTPLTAEEIHRRLRKDKGYSVRELSNPKNHPYQAC
jgi:hypothetical protein